MLDSVRDFFQRPGIVRAGKIAFEYVSTMAYWYGLAAAFIGLTYLLGCSDGQPHSSGSAPSYWSRVDFLFLMLLAIRSMATTLDEARAKVDGSRDS